MKNKFYTPKLNKKTSWVIGKDKNTAYSKSKKVNTKDPYGIPNCCFSLIDKKDNRWKKFKEQRIKKGFDESEFWCFSYTFCHWLLPRLEWYRKHCCWYEEEKIKLDNLIYSVWYLGKYEDRWLDIEMQLQNIKECDYDLMESNDYGYYVMCDCVDCLKENIPTILNMGF